MLQAELLSAYRLLSFFLSIPSKLTSVSYISVYRHNAKNEKNRKERAEKSAASASAKGKAKEVDPLSKGKPPPASSSMLPPPIHGPVELSPPQPEPELLPEDEMDVVEGDDAEDLEAEGIDVDEEVDDDDDDGEEEEVDGEEVSDMMAVEEEELRNDSKGLDATVGEDD